MSIQKYVQQFLEVSNTLHLPTEFVKFHMAEESQELIQRFLSELEGEGPLTELIDDKFVNEIIVNGKDLIFYEKQGQLYCWNDAFASPQTYRNFIERMCLEARTQYNINYPFAVGRWREFRLQIITQDITHAEIGFCLRRHPKSPWTLDRFLEYSWASKEALDFLKKIIAKDQANFLIVGPTGSGKTSVLNACLQEIPPFQRALILEDTSELDAPNLISMKLLTREDPQEHLKCISLLELIRHALRMRPDRLIVGEIRGPEAKDLLMALSTGHSGSMGTLHASTARQALLRLEMLIQLGAPFWSIDAIRSLIFLSLRYLVVTQRSNSPSRRMEGIYELTSKENSGILLEKIY